MFTSVKVIVIYVTGQISLTFVIQKKKNGKSGILVSINIIRRF